MQVGKTFVSRLTPHVTVTNSTINNRLDDALNDEPAFPGVPKGNLGKGRRSDTSSEEWDNSFSKELLGREFIGTKQAFRETEAFYQAKGWSFM